MDLIAIVGVFTVICSYCIKLIGFPHQIKIVKKTKSSAGLSKPLFIFSFVSYILWTTYGVLKRDWVIIAGQCVGIIVAGVTLWLIFFYKHSMEEVEEIKSDLPKPTFTPSEEEYLKKEYDKLNQELEKLLEETRSREKYALPIIAAIATWVYAETLKPVHISLLVKFVGCIPFVIVLIYGISVFYMYKNIKWIGEYLLKIENHFLDKKEEFGWEKYFNHENRKGKFVTVTYSLWIFQLLLALYILVFVFRK